MKKKELVGRIHKAGSDQPNSHRRWRIKLHFVEAKSRIGPSWAPVCFSGKTLGFISGV